MRNRRRPRQDGLEGRRQCVARLRQRRDRKWQTLDGDEKLNLRRALRTFAPRDGGPVAVTAAIVAVVPTEVGVYASSAVMMPLLVVIQVRMKQRRTQGGQLKGDS